MQHSIVNFSEVNLSSDLRIDAEYYPSFYLDRLNLLNHKNNDQLSNLVKFVVGPFGSTVTVDKYVDKSGYRYIRNKDINNFLISDVDPALVSEDVYKLLSKYHIQKDDLLFTVVGTLGKVAIAQEKDNKSIFSCKSTLLRSKKLNPYYLLTYLNSPTGQVFSLRGKRGAIQEGLNLTDLKNIKVFIPSPYFGKLIEKLVKKSFYLLSQSKSLCVQAEQNLLADLGLTSWQPRHKLTFIKNYSNTEQSKRIDAEYFQPKYEEIIKSIKGYAGGWDTLENLVTMKDKNFKPKEKKKYKYIELANIADNGEIADFMLEEGQHLPTRARREVTTGDVIVSSIEGSLSSIAFIDSEHNQSLCSTGFHVIKSESFNSETLLVLLKSIIGQLQLKKGCRGTILTAIGKDEFGKIVLPRIEEKKQTQIQQKIIESFALRKQSKHLLECAKRAVEIAIEKDENEAIRWLEKKTGELQGHSLNSC